MLARLNETKIVRAMQTTGMAVDLKPRARPRMMFGAAPYELALATF